VSADEEKAELGDPLASVALAHFLDRDEQHRAVLEVRVAPTWLRTGTV